MPAKSLAHSTGHCREYHHNGPLLCPATAPAKKSRRLQMFVSTFKHRVFEAPARARGLYSRHVVGAESNNAEEDLLVHRSELGEVLRPESPRDTPVNNVVMTLALMTLALNLSLIHI